MPLASRRPGQPRLPILRFASGQRTLLRSSWPIGLSAPAGAPTGTRPPTTPLVALTIRQRQRLNPSEGFVEGVARARTVRMGSRSRPRDSALRRRPTCTSTVRSSISAACPHTPSSSWARVNTRPGFSRRYSATGIRSGLDEYRARRVGRAGFRGRGRGRRRRGGRRCAPAGCDVRAPHPRH